MLFSNENEQTTLQRYSCHLQLSRLGLVNFKNSLVPLRAGREWSEMWWAPRAGHLLHFKADNVRECSE